MVQYLVSQHSFLVAGSSRKVNKISQVSALGKSNPWFLDKQTDDSTAVKHSDRKSIEKENIHASYPQALCINGKSLALGSGELLAFRWKA